MITQVTQISRISGMLTPSGHHPSNPSLSRFGQQSLEQRSLSGLERLQKVSEGSNFGKLLDDLMDE